MNNLEGISPILEGLDSINEHIIITDTSANILYANKAVFAQTGYATDEIIGKNPGVLWGGKMDKDFYTRMWKTIKEDKKTFVDDVKNIKKDGTEHWQKLIIFPLLDDDGEIKYYIGMEPNIDERKKIEAENKPAYQILEDLNKFILNEQVKLSSFKKIVSELKEALTKN